MTGDWAQPYPPGYREQLQAEATQTSLPRDRKAAIVAELEKLAGRRNADENRTDVETAQGPVTVGRAPSADTVQHPEDNGR